jgi:hypothetical protein
VSVTRLAYFNHLSVITLMSIDHELSHYVLVSLLLLFLGSKFVPSALLS